MKRIVYASYNPFTPEVWVGAHYYSSLLARQGHRVLYLSGLTSPLHHLDKRKRRRKILRKMLVMKKRGVITIPHGPLQYLPNTLLPTIWFLYPMNTSWVARNTMRFTWPPLRKIIRNLGLSRPDIFWIENPKYLPLALDSNPDMLVQRVHDNMVAFPKEKSARRLYIETLRKSQVVFVMSKALIEDYVAELSGDSKKVHYLPNGVAESWFSVPRDLPEPEDLACIPRPRVIMVGVYEFWVDYPKLWRLARFMPDVSFVMVGPVIVKLPPNKPSNIYFLGKKPHKTIPAYLQHSDVGFSIFKRIPLTEYVNLIKLYEYLAMGLPTVSVAHRELTLTKAPWRLANGTEELARAIRESLEIGESERKRYVDFARKNTWEKRFEIVKEVLNL